MCFELELAGGLEPPTCRLQGHRSPTTLRKAGRIAQLRKADRQRGNGSVKGGTLAETLAEQSKLNGSITVSSADKIGDCSTPAPAGALRSSDDFGSSVEGRLTVKCYGEYECGGRSEC
jgi:hypothetical protein